ncbi:ParB/RepB/Spo0J family partition protein [bacterium]|nr:MAG: ParB/RepB/Spo0J family partition protein [bacterium]
MKNRRTLEGAGSATSKKNEKKERSQSKLEFKDSLQDVKNIELVKIEDINLDDKSFQYRVSEKTANLIGSLESEGQLVPVVLWGSKPPFRIIDGFRRITAIKNIGWDSVRAIIHREISEDDAYRLSFIENFMRKSFSPMDIAYAIWKATARGKKPKDLEQEFGLSERQIQRYNAVAGYSADIKKALESDSISIAHASVLNGFDLKNIEEWIERIGKGKLSASALKKILKKEIPRKTKSRKYFKKEKDGFRLYPFRYVAGKSKSERDEIKKHLLAAISIISQEENKEKEESAKNNPTY